MTGVQDRDSNSRRWYSVVFREPLVHFLLVAAFLFVVYQALNPSSDGGEGKRIVVDRAAILNFLQYRSNAFEFDLFSQQLDELSPEDLQFVVDAFVREEVLHREALAMGLDRGDYIIRQRLVQKLEFLIEGTAEAAIQPTPAELQAFYDFYQVDYVEPPVYTFTHVFFDSGQRGEDEALDLATRTLEDLNQNHVAFNAASQWGDRPLFFQNYVDRTRDFVVSHLGEELTAGLDMEEPSDSRWQGPFPSPYGWHLVLMTDKRPARVPDLVEIEERIAEDYMRVQIDQARRYSIDQLVNEYEVDIVDLELDPRFDAE